MNKSDLIETLGKETGLSKTKAVQVVELFFGEMPNVFWQMATGWRSEAFAVSL